MIDLRALVLADDADAIARGLRSGEIRTMNAPVSGVPDYPPLLHYAARAGAAQVFARLLATMGPLDATDARGRDLHLYLRTDQMARLLVDSNHPEASTFFQCASPELVEALSDATVDAIRSNLGLVVCRPKK